MVSMQFGVIVLVAMVASVLVGSAAGNPNRESAVNEPGCTKNYKVEYLKLAIQWGPGYCSTNKKACRSGVFGQSKVKPEFSIHGFWPVKEYESPTNCCARDKYSRNQLKHLAGILKQDWHSLTDNNNDPWSFWEYQYMKHGRCADKISGLSGAYNYFNGALKLWQKLTNPKEVLARKQIHPSNTKTYSGKHILNVLSGAYGNKVGIDCAPSKTDSMKMMLNHIYVCVDLDQERMGCPYTKNSCLGELYYPASF